MIISHRGGVDFVLYATEDERQAIKVVNLFLMLLAQAGDMEDLHPLILPVKEVHRHFPAFAKALHFQPNIDLMEAQKFYEEGERGFCAAVTLRERAYDGEGFRTLSHVLYRRPHLAPEEKKLMILAGATQAGLFVDPECCEHLIALARAALTKMGVIATS